MDAQFEKTLALLAGESIECFEMRSLSDAERTNIKNALDTMFQGHSLLAWLGGVTLGTAWKSAIKSVREAVFEIAIVNTATQFARQQTFALQIEWEQKLTTAAHTNTLIQCPDGKRGEWTADAKLKITTGMEMLMNVISGFATGTPRCHPESAPITIAPNFCQIFDSRNEQENEYVRERK